MLSTDPYSPPKAAVVPDAIVAAPRIPLLFKILLGLFFAIHILIALLLRNGGVGVIQGVMCIAAWRTLQGSGAASRVLGVLIGLYALLLAWGTFMAFRGPLPAAIFSALLLAQAVALVGYIFLNPAMQAAFAKAERKKWSGG